MFQWHVDVDFSLGFKLKNWLDRNGTIIMLYKIKSD